MPGQGRRFRSRGPGQKRDARPPGLQAAAGELRFEQPDKAEQPARRPTRLTTRSVAPSKSSPASELIVPPSKPAFTRRPSTGAKPNKSALHCVENLHDAEAEPS